MSEKSFILNYLMKSNYQFAQELSLKNQFSEAEKFF